MNPKIPKPSEKWVFHDRSGEVVDRRGRLVTQLGEIDGPDGQNQWEGRGCIIAAAPELYAFAKILKEYVGGADDIEITREQLAVWGLFMAVAKAEGK